MIGVRFTLILFTLSGWLSCSTTSQDEKTAKAQSTTQKEPFTYGQTELINQSIPSFQTQTIQGQIISSTYFHHKVTLLNFTSLGCQPCMQEMPILKKLFQTMLSPSFQLVCIAPQTAPQMAQLHPYAIPYAIIAECPTIDALGHPNGAGCHSLSNLFVVHAYPTTLVVDKMRVIRYRHLGFSDQLESIFKVEISHLLEEEEI